MTNLDTAAVEIVVSFDGQQVFRLGADGLVVAPDAASDRASVALALAGASAALAELPAVDTREQTIKAVCAALDSIGTPKAAAALDGLIAAMDGQTAALAAATLLWPVWPVTLVALGLGAAVVAMLLRRFAAKQVEGDRA